MNELECKTCGGIYHDTDSDGVRYFHACSPILNKNGDYIEQPEKRDENIAKKQEGKGVEKIG